MVKSKYNLYSIKEIDYDAVIAMYRKICIEGIKEIDADSIGVFNTVLTEDEQTSVAEGKSSVSVYLEVVDVPVEDVPEEDKAAAAEAVADTETEFGKYLDINLFKEVTTEDEGETTTETSKVTETNSTVRITIEIPEDLINDDEDVNRIYRIVRVHDDGFGNLTTEIIEGEFDPETGTFTFETDRFSTYVLAYSDNPSFVEIEIGEKASASNVRYIEIDGVQTKIDDDDDLYKVVSEGNKLIEIVEKTSDETSVIVKTQYFYISENNASVTKLSMDSYMNAYDGTSIRTKGYTGIIFKAEILTSAKYEDAEFVIDEYGFVVARKDYLGEEELTLDTEKTVVGVGYNREAGIDIVFDNNDNRHIFTGVVKNIPVKHYKTDLVCKSYTKITVNGEQFVVYGEQVVGNLYDTAKHLLETDSSNADLLKIVLDYEGDINIPGDDLYP